MKLTKKLIKRTCACVMAGIITLNSLPDVSIEISASEKLSDNFAELSLGQITESDDMKLIATGDGKTQEVESDGVLTVASTTKGHAGFKLKNERFQQSELTMDFRFNAENNMTHSYEGLYVSPYCVEFDKTFAAVLIQPHKSIVTSQAAKKNSEQIKFELNSGTWYTLKAKTDSNKMSYKIWNRSEPEPKEWTQEREYSLSGDGTLAVYTYQNNSDSSVNVSLDNVVIKNGDKIVMQEDFSSSNGNANSFINKVDVIRDGNNVSDKKTEISNEKQLNLTAFSEGYTGIQYVNYDGKNSMSKLKIKFQEDYAAAGQSDGVFVAPVGNGLEEYAAIGISPADDGIIYAILKENGKEPEDAQGVSSVKILPGVWYNLKVMASEGHDGQKNVIYAKVWSEEEEEPYEWSIEHSYSNAISGGSFSVFTYNSIEQANSVLIDNINSEYYTSGSSSNNVQLSSISVGGTLLEDFDGDILEYVYKVPYISDKQVVPKVTAVAADSDNRVQITQASALPGTALIKVFADNGNCTTYSVNFQLESSKVVSIEEKSITVRKGIDLEEASRPQTVKITLESGKVVDTPVLWNTDEYDPDIQKEQIIKGVLVPQPQYGMIVDADDIPTLKVMPREVQKELYVSPYGNDSNNGTINSPFLTIERAQKEVRKFNSNMTGDIIVYLREGTYAIAEPMKFDVSDSGSNGYYVVYQNYQDETPEISGGKVLDAVWEEDPERPGVYKTALDRDRKLRSLYVNGEPAKITEYTVTGKGTVGTMTITGEESWAETSGKTWTGIKFDKSDVDVYANPEDVEIMQSKIWNSNTVGIQNIYEDGDYIIFEPQQPFGAIFSKMAWNCNLSGTGSITIRNTLENLKNPGEFYFDRSEKTLYYYPNEGTNINDMEFVIPESEGLIRMNGVSTDKRIENIEFSGINFCYDHYNLEVIDDPENGMHSIGYGGVQSLGLYRKFSSHGNWHHSWYNIVDTPYASIDVQNAKGIIFEGNHFMNLSSSCAVSYTNDVTESVIQGNAFINIAGNATNIGHPQHVFIGEDAKSDSQRFPVGVEGICKNNQVVYNLVRNVSSEFYQCDAIMAFFVENCDFSHNDVANVPYTAICVGWGWWNFNGDADSEVPGNPSLTAKNNRILFNKFGNTHNKLPKDGGVLYTLGYQPDSIIAYNYLYNGNRAIYPDEGSRGLTIHDNVIEKPGSVWLYLWRSDGRSRDNIIFNNYTSTSSVSNGYPQGNLLFDTHVEKDLWSEPAQNIIDNAGLTGNYTKLYELLNINTSKLEKEIERAKALSENDYDSESWNNLQQVLSDCEKYLNSNELSQGTIDMMRRKLNKAIEGLKSLQDNMLVSDVSNFNITEDNGRLILSWEPPHTVFDHYVLTGLGETVEIAADSNRYVIDNVQPGKIYILTLCVIDSEGKCSKGVTKIYVSADNKKDATDIVTSNVPAQNTLKEGNQVKEAVAVCMTKPVRAGKNQNVLRWTKVKGADGYFIYTAKCGKSNSKLKKIKDINNADTTKWTHKGLKKNTWYKYRVAAYRIIDGKKVQIGRSLEMYSLTKGSTEYANPKSVKVTKKVITLKKGKKAKIAAKVVLQKGKKTKWHIKKLRYICTDKKIASVTASGTVRAKKKGTCTVYVVAQNGVSSKVKIKVR